MTPVRNRGAGPAETPAHAAPDAPAGGAPRVVPFLRTEPSAEGLAGVERAVRETDLKARGAATRRCEELLSARLDQPAAVLMVQSCTAALELSAMLLDVGPGDEVIMPSFGFASAANAFVLRGATPVFADISPGTLNLDPAAVRAALTPQTRAIVVVHYAGVAADMDALLQIAGAAGVPLVEDAAQGIGAAYGDRPLGTLGALGAISFDATKNLTAGSGGALVINDPVLAQNAETLRDYGTDRARFARGEVARYRWVLAGKNAAMNELAAAYLAPQLEALDTITAGRLRTWHRYHGALAGLERDGLVTRPVVPPRCTPNAHIYGLVLATPAERTRVLAALRTDGVEATFHYVPLHSAPAGEQFGRASGDLPRTTDLSARLLRLPLWNDMPDADTDHVIAAVERRVREYETPGAR